MYFYMLLMYNCKFKLKKCNNKSIWVHFWCLIKSFQAPSIPLAPYLGKSVRKPWHACPHCQWGSSNPANPTHIQDSSPWSCFLTIVKTRATCPSLHSSYPGLAWVPALLSPETPKMWVINLSTASYVSDSISVNIQTNSEG